MMTRPFSRLRLVRAIRLALGCAFLTPALAQAAPIAVENHSFETPVTNPGEFQTSTAPPGWSTYGSINFSGRVVGVLNPASTTLYAEPAPERDNVGVVFLLPSFTNSEAGLQQTLAATLETDTVYTLEVDVGNIANDATPPHNAFAFGGFPGYRIELLAGTNVLAADDNSLLPDEGRFLRSNVQVAVGNPHPDAGEPLTIRLINLDSAAGIEVNFDDVQLDATAFTPTPTSTPIPTSTPTPTPSEPIAGCPPTPPLPCRAAASGRGSLSLSGADGRPERSKMNWKWKGEATALGDFGAPNLTTAYRVCLYDGAGAIQLDLAVPAGGTCAGKDCWKSLRTGFSYRDREAAAAGLSRVVFKAGVDGRASIQVQANGAGFALPGLPLAVAPEPARAVLINEESGLCWAAEFSTPRGDTANAWKWLARND
jgi:hypothetical protein